MERNYPVTVIQASTLQSIRYAAPGNLLHCSSCFPDFILNDLVTGKVGKDWDPKIDSDQGQFPYLPPAKSHNEKISRFLRITCLTP